MASQTKPEFKTLYRPASWRKESNHYTECSDVSVWTRSGKRKACAEDTPQKRKRTCESDPGSSGDRKRKSPMDKEHTRKRLRTLEDIIMVKGTKRNATEYGDVPTKRQKVPEPDQKDQQREGSVEAAAPSNNGATTTTTSTSEETSRQEFQAKYQELDPLGEGGHGSVYAGYRREDHFPVAIKHIPRKNVICKGVVQKTRTLPLEVAVMIKMAEGAAGAVGKSASISLLDHYDLEQELILVLERPVSSVDLFEYTEVKGGSLQEEEARLLLKQLVEAAKELQSKRIFHRDIKMENILIETSSDVPRLRLIDFGLSCFTKKSSSYSIFYGTSAHIPPEWYQCCAYRAGPTTVWQLGVVLYDMLHSQQRFDTTGFLSNRLNVNEDLSKNCQDMLRLCLAVDPQERPTLEQLRLHPWLT